RNDTQRTHAREIAVVRHQGGGVDCQRAGRLNSVCQLEAERCPQSCGAFRNVEVKLDRLPRCEDCTITPREGVVSSLQGPGQHLGDGDGGYGETQVPGSM